MSSRRRVVVIDQPGQRLDKALAEAMPDVSRAQFQRLISEGRVTVNGVPAKAAAQFPPGLQVVIDFPPSRPVDTVPENIPLDIRYEDGEILVINKPAGMVVHPSPGHQGGTLVNGILAHCPEIEGVGGEQRPGIVHRLDRDTSGLIVVAKTDRALHWLQEQFQKRQVKKRYLALVSGRFNRSQMIIDAPIGRDPRDRKKMAVIAPGSSATARSAQTEVLVLQRYQQATLLECRPRTGRTHQIRVHLAFSGFPIVGDEVYGPRKRLIPLERHFLHAAGLAFLHPTTGTELSLEAELPLELDEVLQTLVLEE